MSRIKALVIAEAANPEWFSVPLEGWSLATALRAIAEVHIVTQIRNRDAFLRAGLVEGEDFTAIDSEALARPMWRIAEVLRLGKGKGWTMTTAMASLSYPYFESLLWRRFGDDIKAGRFDVVHRVTPLTPTASSPVAAKCRRAGVPFVMGPLNGGVPWPPGFDAERRREQEWLSYVRGAYRALPGLRTTYAAASAIIVGSRHTQSEVPARFQEKCVYIPENGIDPTRFNLRSTHNPDGPLRGCFVGRLVPYKGPDMLIEAAAPLMREGKLALDIIGDGPLMPSLRAQADRENVTSAVTFHGWLQHHDVQDVMVRSAIMPFPSIREFGGAVVLEAMALGVVPVVVDYGGVGEHVRDGIGFKTPIGRRDEIVHNFKGLLEKAVDERSNLAQIGANAQKVVSNFYTWPHKAKQVHDVWRDVIETGGPRAGCAEAGPVAA